MRVESSIDATLTDDIKRLGHICVTYKNLILVWGGFRDGNANEPSQDKEPEDLWIYDPLTQCWSIKKCHGTVPPGLTGSASSVIGDKLYVFGGYSDSAKGHLNTLYCLNLKHFIWSLIDNIKGIAPVPSDKCVSWTYNQKLYIFGGYGLPNIEHITQLFDRQHNLQFTRDSSSPWSYRRGWNNQLVEYNPNNNQWNWPVYSGECPSARAAHAGALMGSKYYIFGGRNNQKRLNDLYSLDMRKNVWSKIEPKIPFIQQQQSPVTPPLTRILHQTSNINNNNDGGCNSLPNDSNQSSSLSSSNTSEPLTPIQSDDDNHRQLQQREIIDNNIVGQDLDSNQYNVDRPQQQIANENNAESIPRGRSWTSFTPISTETIVLYGGFSQEETALDDCWIFNIKNETWTKVPLPFSKPRLWHTGTQSPYDEIIIFGGSATKVTSSAYETTKQFYCDELLTLRVSPKTLVRLSLDKVAESCADLGEHILKLPCNLQSLVMSKSKTRKNQTRKHL